MSDAFPVSRSWLRKLVLFFGLSFLYVPMIILVVYSFNSSRLVTVWGGWSTHWYAELFQDQAIINAALLSLTIAFMVATAAVVLGTIAAFVMTRMGRFKGQNAFAFMITAPLVMPEVITGLALLLLFVALGQMIGWPAQRGITTIWIAHVTMTCAYVAIVVSARLRELDRSLDEAAMDLGARPLKAFFVITLPLIAPAIMSGWLLAFTLSIDDLVIASFVSGPNASTLPMVVFSSVRLGVSPKINALATIIIGIVSLIGLLAWLSMARAERRRAKEMALADK